MKYDSLHPEYVSIIDKIRICRDCYAGESLIKSKGDVYLPRLSDQSDEGFKSYLDRSVYYAFLYNTIQGRVGQIMRKSPIFVGSDEGLYVEDITIDHKSGSELVSTVIEELLKVGRVGLLLDYSDRPYVSIYHAEDIHNWVESDGVLQSVLLKESLYELKDSGYVEQVIRYRLLELSGGQYKATIMDDSGSILEEIYPSIQGRKLSSIPFIFINSNSTSSKTNNPPLLDVALLSLAIYRNSADYEQILHTLAVPTPYGTGIEPDELGGDFVLGPYEFKEFLNPDAKLGMLEFTGSGIDSIRQAIEDKMLHISAIGGSVAFSSSKQVEQAETARLRIAAETAALSSIVNNAERGINYIYKQLSEWDNDSNIVVKINRDFLDNPMTPEMLKGINESVVMNLMSKEAAFSIRQKMELYPDGWTYEKEESLLDEQETPDNLTTNFAGSVSLVNNSNNEITG